MTLKDDAISQHVTKMKRSKNVEFSMQQGSKLMTFRWRIGWERFFGDSTPYFFCLPIVTCWLTEPYDPLVWQVQETRDS